jgi:hypothetical protein
MKLRYKVHIDICLYVWLNNRELSDVRSNFPTFDPLCIPVRRGFFIGMKWQPDHRGVLTLWRDDDAIAALSPVYEENRTLWHWYSYISSMSGFCATPREAQDEAERSIGPNGIH